MMKVLRYLLISFVIGGCMAPPAEPSIELCIWRWPISPDARQVYSKIIEKTLQERKIADAEQKNNLLDALSGAISIHVISDETDKALEELILYLLQKHDPTEDETGVLKILISMHKGIEEVLGKSSCVVLDGIFKSQEKRLLLWYLDYVYYQAYADYSLKKLYPESCHLSECLSFYDKEIGDYLLKQLQQENDSEICCYYLREMEYLDRLSPTFFLTDYLGTSCLQNPSCLQNQSGLTNRCIQKAKKRRKQYRLPAPVTWEQLFE